MTINNNNNEYVSYLQFHTIKETTDSIQSQHPNLSDKSEFIVGL
jgi:hypothetical protein